MPNFVKNIIKNFPCTLPTKGVLFESKILLILWGCFDMKVGWMKVQMEIERKNREHIPYRKNNVFFSKVNSWKCAQYLVKKSPPPFLKWLICGTTNQYGEKYLNKGPYGYPKVPLHCYYTKYNSRYDISPIWPPWNTKNLH